MITQLIIALVLIAAWIFMGWATGRLFNIRWRALFFIGAALAASAALPSAADARHRHHHAHRHHHLAPQARAQATLSHAAPADRLMTHSEAKALLHSVDAELAPAILINLDLDFAKACLMAYGLKRLEEMKREAER